MALFAGTPLRTIETIAVMTGARVPAARGPGVLQEAPGRWGRLGGQRAMLSVVPGSSLLVPAEVVEQTPVIGPSAAAGGAATA